MDKFGFELRDMNVVGENGSHVGTLQNITMEVNTGELGHLLVKPDPQQNQNMLYEKNRDGYYKVPANLVKAVDDNIVLMQT